MRFKTYDEMCQEVNKEWAIIKKPTIKDIIEIARKLQITKEEVRECVGLKDFLDFEVNLND